MTGSANRCTHLVVRSIARTVKFFMAFSLVKYVVTPDWITQSARAGKFLGKCLNKKSDCSGVFVQYLVVYIAVVNSNSTSNLSTDNSRNGCAVDIYCCLRVSEAM